MLKWLPFVGITVLGTVAVLNCSIESSHVVKKEITYDNGQLKRIMIYDSSFHNLNAQVEVYV